MIKHNPVKNQFNVPNTTQTPNCFYDFYLKILKDAELRVTGAVIRHTYGWHEKDHRFAMSLTDLVEVTELARPNVQRACKSLISPGKTKSGKDRPAILGRKRVKGGKYLYWLLIHTAESMGKGVHAASTPENGENNGSGVHAPSTELYMQHGQQLYMQHVPPCINKHVNIHVKTKALSSPKVPTARAAKKTCDDNSKNAIPDGSNGNESKISHSPTESSVSSHSVGVQPRSESDNIVIRRTFYSDGSHDPALVAKWFERLSNGGRWRKHRDLTAYHRVNHVRIEIIIQGLCYSLVNARGHSFSRFSYAIPAILNAHSEAVQYGLDGEELRNMAAYHVAITVEQLKSGKWNVTDYDPAELADFNANSKRLARTVLALTAS